MKIKLLLLALLFFVKFGFAQNTVSYSPLNQTLNLKSGEEGSVNVVATCVGSSSSNPPIALNAEVSCGTNDGYMSFKYSNGNLLFANQTSTLTLKFKKTVTQDTQIIYKFSTNNNCFQDESKMIKITVNYKSGSTTTPTNPTNPTNPTVPNIEWSKIAKDQTINEGNSAELLVGGDAKENFKKYDSVLYQWKSSTTSTGNYQPIAGATSKDYSPGVLNVTTYFKRDVTYKVNNNGVSGSDGTKSSNIVTITVIPAPPLLNNTISRSGSELQGSLPSGGTGTYVYYWYAYVLQDEDPWLIGQSINCTIPNSVYKFVDSMGYNGYINRVVVSGKQQLVSNTITITPSIEITNNTITLSGNSILGSLPSGGTGSFTYEYYVYNEFPDGEIVDGVSVVGFNQNYDSVVHGYLTTKYYRKVYSGNRVSTSNTITILPKASSVKMATTNYQETVSGDLIVYPNPTTESVNFSTNFSTNKEIEIVVYSDKLQNEKSVFKGTVIPNQIVNWKIPSSYLKGIYFYKILSGGAEVKTGKLIYQ